MFLAFVQFFYLRGMAVTFHAEQLTHSTAVNKLVACHCPCCSRSAGYNISRWPLMPSMLSHHFKMSFSLSCSGSFSIQHGSTLYFPAVKQHTMSSIHNAGLLRSWPLFLWISSSWMAVSTIVSHAFILLLIMSWNDTLCLLYTVHVLFICVLFSFGFIPRGWWPICRKSYVHISLILSLINMLCLSFHSACLLRLLPHLTRLQDCFESLCICCFCVPVIPNVCGFPVVEQHIGPSLCGFSYLFLCAVFFVFGEPSIIPVHQSFVSD